MAQKLYVGNFPYSMTEDTLRDLFSQHGEVSSVAVVMDRETGRPRGFGFVEMDNADAAIEALNGHELEGRALNVNIAKERSGGGGGGGGGRW